MRNLSAAQKEALADPATMLVTIWRITRLDGAILRLTDLDGPLVADGNVYASNGSTERTSIRLSDGLAADNLDIKGILRSAAITEADIQNGRYDYAALLVSLAFANLSLPSIPIASGRFGEVTMDNGAYEVQVNGLSQGLQATLGEMTTPTCRANLGDARCRAPLATWRDTYTISSVVDARTIYLSPPLQLDPAATYAGGVLEVMDGPAAGLSMEVRRMFVLPTIYLDLYLPLPVMPVAGNTVRVTTGCDKSLATCKAVFGNVINFQGEPHIPGIDALAAPEVR